MLKCTDIICEYLTNPVGIDNPSPRFSWRLQSEDENVTQSAYEIEVVGMWSSGRVLSDCSVHVRYEGPLLASRTRYSVKVRVWDNKGNCSDYATGYFETAYFNVNDINARFIAAAEDTWDISPVFKRNFTLAPSVRNARLYITAYGMYEVSINKKRVSDTYLTPGFTSYNKRLQYQTFDVGEYLREGENVIEILLAKGWTFGRISCCREHNIFNRIPSVLAQLNISYADGTDECVCTDETWEYAHSALLFSEIYDGEVYDQNLEGTEIFSPCRVLDYGKENLVAQVGEYVRIIKEFSPKRIITTPKGERVIDFGQNIAGFAGIKICGKKGERVTVSHAEVLDKDGNFYTENLRSAKQQNTFILSGRHECELMPRLTFQGFQYIRLDEFPGEVKLQNFKAYAICTDMKKTSDFTCSEPLLNKLYENVLWGQRDNFIDIPTDCPQRDERVGWTGDAMVFAPTAMRNMFCAPFFTKWLADLAADQFDDGGVPVVIPVTVNEWKCTSALYSDAATVCPFEVYKAYGDVEILEKQYDSMKKWVEYIRRQGDDEFLWNTGFQYGDWLGLDAEQGDYRGSTPSDLIATAYYAQSTLLLAKSARILNKANDAEQYLALYKNVKQKFSEEFFDSDGNLLSDTQTAHAIALSFMLTPSKEKTAKRLAELVIERGHALCTGFAGTPLICGALSDNGYGILAYDLLLRREYPSWLYTVLAGATTVWEHWDGIKPDGSMWDKAMNSFNHYAYGSIFDWVFGNVLGIKTDESAPGYKHIIIDPLYDGRLTYASGYIETMYGRVSVAFELRNGKTEYTVAVPANTTAFLKPISKNVGSGIHTFVL